MNEPRRTINARIPTSTVDAVDEVLEEHNLQRNSLIEALYNLLIANPTDTLTLLRPHWPAPRPEGRPRKRPAPPKT